MTGRASCGAPPPHTHIPMGPTRPRGLMHSSSVVVAREELAGVMVFGFRGGSMAGGLRRGRGPAVVPVQLAASEAARAR